MQDASPENRDDLKSCPLCAERIKKNAIRCKHCHADLIKAHEPQPREGRERLAPLLSFAIIGSGQIFNGRIVSGLAAFVISVIVFEVQRSSDISFSYAIAQTFFLVLPLYIIGVWDAFKNPKKRVRLFSIILSLYYLFFVGQLFWCICGANMWTAYQESQNKPADKTAETLDGPNEQFNDILNSDTRPSTTTHANNPVGTDSTRDELLNISPPVDKTGTPNPADDSSAANPSMMPSIPNPFVHPSANLSSAPSPAPAPISMPKIGGPTPAPMAKAGIGVSSATDPGAAPAPINIATGERENVCSGPPIPVPVGGSSTPKRVDGRAAGGGSLAISVAPFVAPAASGGNIDTKESGKPTEFLVGSSLEENNVGNLTSYLRIVQTRIKRAWYPPVGEAPTDVSVSSDAPIGAHLSAARRGQYKKMSAAFEIHKDGQVTNLRIEISSGSEMTDAAALKAVVNAAPFNPLPQSSPEAVDVMASFQSEVGHN